jgi:hypothetical protein
MIFLKEVNMPISRNYVKLICTPREYDVYIASLRLRLPTLGMPELRIYICRTRGLIDEQRKKRPMAQAARRNPRKADLLSDALLRFEGRLRTLARTKPAGGKQPRSKSTIAD